MNARSGNLGVQELDVFACPLDGVNQIEASAGTGKTWNICALYVRLLLEKKLAADQILVVTFTKAATAELARADSRAARRTRARDRNRRRRRRCRSSSAFSKRRSPTSIMTRRSNASTSRCTRSTRPRSTRSTRSASARCRKRRSPPRCRSRSRWKPTTARCASNWPPTSGASASSPRRRASARSPSWLVAKGAGPASLDAQLARRLKKPLAALRWGDLDCGGVGGRASDLRYGVRALARGARRRSRRLLVEAEAKLSKTTHKRDV